MLGRRRPASIMVSERRSPIKTLMSENSGMLVLLATLALAADPTDWRKTESAYLHNIKQVTQDFVRAGEGYFAPDGKTIIFQAEEKGTGNPFYQIFTMDLSN